MSMTHTQLVDFGISRGMTLVQATQFALDVTSNGKKVNDPSVAEALLVGFAATTGIVLVGVNDALLGIPGEIASVGVSVVGEGLGFLADLFF